MACSCCLGLSLRSTQQFCQLSNVIVELGEEASSREEGPPPLYTRKVWFRRSREIGWCWRRKWWVECFTRSFSFWSHWHKRIVVRHRSRCKDVQSLPSCTGGVSWVLGFTATLSAVWSLVDDMTSRSERCRTVDEFFLRQRILIEVFSKLCNWLLCFISKKKKKDPTS